MNKAAAFSLAFVLGSLTATAQAFGQAGGESTILHPLPTSMSCPVGMLAQQEGGFGATSRIIGPQTNGPQINGKPLDGGQPKPKGIGQQLHITLTNSKSVAIAGIKITVHGYIGKGGLLFAQAAQDDSPDATRTLNLKMTVDAKKDGSTDVWLSGFRAVTLIDIDSVTYADGSNWRSSALESCHFGPDIQMLISSR